MYLGHGLDWCEIPTGNIISGGFMNIILGRWVWEDNIGCISDMDRIGGWGESLVV